MANPFVWLLFRVLEQMVPPEPSLLPVSRALINMSAGLGRIVDVADVAKYRKKDHSPCMQNSGALVVIENGKKTYRPCACAVRRFNKKNGHNVEIIGNEVRWKPGTAPPQIS